MVGFNQQVIIDFAALNEDFDVESALGISIMATSLGLNFWWEPADYLGPTIEDLVSLDPADLKTLLKRHVRT